MKKIAATLILLPNGELVENHTLVLTDEGAVAEVLPIRDTEAEFYEGILSPGFINAHCHLELSHFKNEIAGGKGLDGFIEGIVNSRQKPQEQGLVQKEIRDADKHLWETGTQGVGDICNTDHTFEIKTHSPIRYHSFVEVFNMDENQAKATFENGLSLLRMAENRSLSVSIVPHAPYSVPPALHELIKTQSEQNASSWCIHNQETEAEYEMFHSSTGRLADFFRKRGFNSSWHRSYLQSSLEFVTGFFPANSNLMLVHNTFTRAADIDLLYALGVMERVWFCLCPRANLYIENQLPDLPLLMNSGCRFTIGTDSLASNHNLSVWDEIKTLHNAFPQIPLSSLLTWATANGADYFNWNELGRFTVGAQPGVVLITGATEMEISEKSEVRRII